MADEQRKKQIRQHLTLSSGEINFLPEKKSRKPSNSGDLVTPEPLPTPEPPAPSPKIVPNKRAIMDHLMRSSDEFGKFSLSPEQRKKQIQEHIRKSQNSD